MSQHVGNHMSKLIARFSSNVSYFRNRLNACKFLIGMAALLPFVPAQEMYTINQVSCFDI